MKDRRLNIEVDVCPACGHAVDHDDNLWGKRGCFGRREERHPRAERIRVSVALLVRVGEPPATGGAFK